MNTSVVAAAYTRSGLNGRCSSGHEGSVIAAHCRRSVCMWKERQVKYTFLWVMSTVEEYIYHCSGGRKAIWWLSDLCTHNRNEFEYRQYYPLHITLTLLWHILKIVGCSLLYQSNCDSSIMSACVQYITHSYCMHDCERTYAAYEWRSHVCSCTYHHI